MTFFSKRAMIILYNFITIKWSFHGNHANIDHFIAIEASFPVSSMTRFLYNYNNILGRTSCRKCSKINVSTYI